MIKITLYFILIIVLLSGCDYEMNASEIGRAISKCNDVEGTTDLVHPDSPPGHREAEGIVAVRCYNKDGLAFELRSDEAQYNAWKRICDKYHTEVVSSFGDGPYECAHPVPETPQF